MTIAVLTSPPASAQQPLGLSRSTPAGGGDDAPRAVAQLRRAARAGRPCRFSKTLPSRTMAAVVMALSAALVAEPALSRVEPVSISGPVSSARPDRRRRRLEPLGAAQVRSTVRGAARRAPASAPRANGVTELAETAIRRSSGAERRGRGAAVVLAVLGALGGAEDRLVAAGHRGADPLAAPCRRWADTRPLRARRAGRWCRRRRTGRRRRAPSVSATRSATRAISPACSRAASRPRRSSSSEQLDDPLGRQRSRSPLSGCAPRSAALPGRGSIGSCHVLALPHVRRRRAPTRRLNGRIALLQLGRSSERLAPVRGGYMLERWTAP